MTRDEYRALVKYPNSLGSIAMMEAFDIFSDLGATFEPAKDGSILVGSYESKKRPYQLWPSQMRLKLSHMPGSITAHTSIFGDYDQSSTGTFPAFAPYNLLDSEKNKSFRAVAAETLSQNIGTQFHGP